MIMMITDENKRVANWASKFLDGATWQNPQCFGFQENGNLIGAVIFTNYSKNDIQVNVVSTNPRWWQKRFISHLFDYVWDTCGCNRVSSVVKKSNEKAHKLNKTIGFKQEGIARQFFENENGQYEDGIIYGLLRDEDTPKWYKDRRTING